MPITHLVFDFYKVLFAAQQQSQEFCSNLSTEQYLPFLNQELLAFLRQLPSSISLSIYSSSLMLKIPLLTQQLQPLFTTILISKDLKLPKDHPDSYRALATLLATEPDNLLFIDDQLQNVEAAQKASWSAIQFENNQDLFTQLKRLI